jgi:hypothetical protein
MTEIADDRSWWADVEHLRPGGEGHRPASSTTSSRASAVAERADRPAIDPRSELGVGTAAAEPAMPRRLRITGGTPESAAPARPRRPDVAAFADALDLDGAFGAPVTAPRSREIILTGTSSAPDADDVVTPDDEDVPEGDDDLAPAADRHRRTVQIRGTAGVHADVAERRALRELGERRPRTTAVERVAGRPDRIAMYVVLLGVFLVFLAVAGQSAGS